MSAEEYTLTEFPDDATMARVARSCPHFCYCAERPFSFCLKRFIQVENQFYFHKVTYKHCWECSNSIDE